MSYRAPIYLDYNATTPITEEVLDAMLPILRDGFGNPSSDHVYGLRARSFINRAREQVARLLFCDPDEIVFTSGGTESNNLAIQGVASANPHKTHVITSTVEHPAVEQPCQALEAQKYRITRLEVDRNGCIDPTQLEGVCDEKTLLMTIMHANNETGSIMPIAAAAAYAHKQGALVHTDAAQSAGKIPVYVDQLGVDLLSIAGHKLYAPKGIGALYIRRGTAIKPFMRGAGHERGLRPGTENVVSIVGLGMACEIASRNAEEESRRLRELRDNLWQKLADAIEGVEINGHPTRRLPNTLNIRFRGVRGSNLLRRCTRIAASTGSACHAGSHETPSAVLLKMGIEATAALGSLRLSVGRPTTFEEIKEAATALILAHRELTV